MRRDPKEYQSVKLLHSLNKYDQDKADKAHQPPKLFLRKKSEKVIKDILEDD